MSANVLYNSNYFPRNAVILFSQAKDVKRFAVYVWCNVVLTFCCNTAWIHIKCDCIHQHLPGSTVVWLSVFNLLKCTLAFFHDIENLKLALSWHHVWGSDFHWHGHTHFSLSYWCRDFKVIKLFLFWAALSFSVKIILELLYVVTVRGLYFKLDHESITYIEGILGLVVIP